MQVDNTANIPIRMWLNQLEDGAKAQAINLANLPFAFKHVAIMPDCHMGYGMPIGGVLATQGVVIPNAVGVDIGCGMLTVKTSLLSHHISRTELYKIANLIKQRIPTGFNKHQVAQKEALMPRMHGKSMHIVGREYFNTRKSLGTLGGGNHFIEIQVDEEGFLWVMIHSGSRNLGKQVADYYNQAAKKLNAQWYSSVDPKHDLAFLPLDQRISSQYLDEMNFCVEFALANRKVMMQQVLEILREVVQGCFIEDDPINIAHNYARMEHHFGKNVMVHRKGATSAKICEIGIIPGSQGTSSYIVRGLGNPQSFMSCSHGAGRAMGRKQACRELNLGEQQTLMGGIIHDIRSEKDLDEAPGAYKDIDAVLANQRDLVEIVTRLQPLAVVKG